MPRFECTPQTPWDESKGPSFHPDANVIKEANDIAFSEGNKTEYECPHCSSKFKVTEPDY